ncbi:MAG TPA: Ku protein [Burkholderiales bacterium]|nr:Ku protein [Burkholderiales bacterium]
MARGLWKGAISFGLVNVPVELFSAQKRSAEVSLTMLDRRDMAPVGYQRVNKATGKEVPWEDVVKGYEYEDDKYVVLSEEDFRRANPEASKTVDIVAFVDAQDIAPLYYETPYYLAPGKRGEKAYALLRDAMAKAGKAGIATVVIRTKQYLAAVVAQGDALILNTLRYHKELKSAADLEIAEKVKGHKPSSKELDMALTLIEDMADEWQPEKYHDTYHEDLLERIEEKVKAGETEVVAEPEKEAREPKRAEVVDLMALLKKSVEGGGRKGGAKGKAAANDEAQEEKVHHRHKRASRKRRAA